MTSPKPPPPVTERIQAAVTGAVTGVAGSLPTVGGAVRDAVTGVSGLIPGADAAGSLLDVLVATRRWVSVRHNWVRVAWTVSGVALMWAGALMVIKPEVSSAVQAVGEVPGAGKAIKAVT